MRNILFGLGVGVLALALGADCQAQGRGQRGFGGGGLSKSALLRLDSVQDELGLEEVQIEDLQQALGGGRGERGAGGERPNFRDMSDEERRAAMQERREQMTTMQQAQEEKLAEILDADQMERLGEIYVQVGGVAALMDPATAEHLGITEEQQDEMRQAVRDAMSDMRGQRGEGDREGMRERMAEAREKMQQAAVDVLSTEQQEQYEAMKGEPFALSQEDRQALVGGGMRRGGGPGGDAQGQRRMRQRGGNGEGADEGGRPRRGRPEADE